MNNTTIILGDPHIGKGTTMGRVGLGSALNSRITDQIQLLDWTLLQAVKAGAKHLILTGDVFEEPKPNPYLITLFISWLKRCDANDIHVHVILGNHDVLRTGNFYTSPLDIISECEMENVTVYKDITTLLLDGVAFTFVPFRDRKSFNVDANAQAVQFLRDILLYELASIPSTYRKILVGHLALEGSIPVGDEIDDMMNELFCPLDMFQGYDYVWMGHVHKPQVMSTSPHIAHIGSMDISNFGETDQKKHIIIYDPEDADNEFRTAELPTRPLRKVLVSVPKGTENTTQYVVDEIKANYATKLNKAIVRLEVYLTGPELPPTNRTELENCLYDLGAYYVPVISESKKLSAVVKNQEENILDTTIDVPAAIKLWARTQIDEASKNKFVEASVKIYNDYLLVGER